MILEQFDILIMSHLGHQFYVWVFVFFSDSEEEACFVQSLWVGFCPEQ